MSTDVAEPSDETTGSLAPRALPGSGKTRRRWVPMLLVGLVLVGGGVIVMQFLTSAVDYYCNVDEVGQRSGCDADRRLRVQGMVTEGSVSETEALTTFDIEFNGVVMPVTYDGEPGGIFRECVPVVVHGELNSGTGVFRGDRVEVKHSDQYVAENSDRLTESDADANACDAAESAGA